MSKLTVKLTAHFHCFSSSLSATSTFSLFIAYHTLLALSGLRCSPRPCFFSVVREVITLEHLILRLLSARTLVTRKLKADSVIPYLDVV